MLGFTICNISSKAARMLASCASCACAVQDSQRINLCCRSALILRAPFSNATGKCSSALVQLEVKPAVLHPQQGNPSFCSHGRLRRTFSSGVYPPHEVLSMPALSPTMEVGNLVQWKVKEGDEVEAGAILADIETDKATLGLETQDDGFIAKLIVDNGTSDIPVGAPIAVLVDSADTVQAFSDYKVLTSATNADTEVQKQKQNTNGHAAAAAHRNRRIGPAAKMALANAGLSPEDVWPTGPNGILTKSDVLAAVAVGSTLHPVASDAQKPVEEKVATPTQCETSATVVAEDVAITRPMNGRLPRGERYTDEPVTTMRRVIAQRLLQSKQSLPAIYMTACARLSALSELRSALKKAGVKASVNDFVIKAVAKALVNVPGACSGWDEAANDVLQFPDVDISVAVATEGGLITPIVKAADQKSLSEIGATMKDLAGRARENKLKPEEFMGGSFCISNLGMFGVKEFSAIINPPQACILAVGGPQQECIKQGDHLVMDPFINVRLSADNRAVDEATAAAFLDSFVFHIENPGLLMA